MCMDLKTICWAHPQGQHTPNTGRAPPATCTGPVWLLIWTLGLRWVTLLLLVSVWRETLGTGAPPALPNAGEGLWVGKPSLERRTSRETRLRWWQVVKFLLILQTEAVILLIAACPFFSRTQRHTGTVPWHRCWGGSIILSETYKIPTTKSIMRHFNPAKLSSNLINRKVYATWFQWRPIILFLVY